MSTAPQAVPTGTAPSRALARWAASLDSAAQPDLAAVVRERVIDYLANVMAGSDRPSVTRLMRMASRSGPGAVPLADGSTAPAEWAALPLGGAAHVLECDDTHQPSSSHPGAVVLSTALPLAIELDLPWSRVVDAIVAGYEVMCRIGEASGPANEYQRAFHPTGTCGAFGATTAAVLLLGGDEDQLTDALGIANSLSSGSMAFLTDGSWTKHLHPGWAAHSGIVAARLALDGFKGPEAALEGQYGYLIGHSGNPDPTKITAGLGRAPLAVERTSVKAHGCCRYEQAALDAVLHLRKTHSLRPEDVAMVRVGVLTAGWDIIVEPAAEKRRPRTPVDAQFSMPFGAAVALLHGRASVAEHSQDNVDDPAVHALMDRVECFRSAELDAAFPQRWPAVVEILHRDGRTLRHSVDHPKGDPENPFSPAELLDKFRELNPGRPAEVASALADLLDDLGAGGPTRQLASWMQSAWRTSTTTAEEPATERMIAT